MRNRIEAERLARAIPPRAVVISVAALAVPIIGQTFFVESMADNEALLWLLALVPAFLLAYYRGWRGAAGALAGGMLVLAIAQIVLSAAGRRVENWSLFFGVTLAILVLSLAIGWVSELLHQQREKAEALAMLDELTGLPNRRLANRFLEMEVAAALRGRRITLVMFDLDHFKRYNDTHGHAAGDQVLVAMGYALDHNTRKMNLSARWGGEEFISILSDSDAKGALIFVQRVRETLAAASLPAGSVTFSVGVAEFGHGIASSEDLLRAADTALYQTKADGRGGATVFEPRREDELATWVDPDVVVAPATAGERL